MDPLRTDPRPAEALSGTERDARIEQLLLAGLDEYFAHRYEHAINLWTRVLFLDRTHDRARAYIDRARRAQAERQRESDAALHQADQAFRAGDAARARQLVSIAIERGASIDDAQGMLERIDRLDVAQASSATMPATPRRRYLSTAVTWAGGSAPTTAVPVRAPHVTGWLAALLLAAAAIGVLGVGAWGLTLPEPSTWPIFASRSADTNYTAPWAAEPLPTPNASEMYLTRARALVATGRLRDALSALERIPPGDTLQRDADALRADIQRQLLSFATTEPPPE